MQTIATVSLPIFALLFSGYGAKRLGLLNEPSIVGLNGFVYYFALPALFVVKVSETPVVRLFDWRLIAAGALLSVAGLPLPAPVKAFATLLGGAALPCALFALGASLVGRPIATGEGEVALLVGLKLLVHPLAVWAMVTHLFALQPLWAKVAVIEAALPTAANVFVLAQRYDVYVDRASAIVFISTLLSVVTVSALLASLTGQ